MLIALVGFACIIVAINSIDHPKLAGLLKRQGRLDGSVMANFFPSIATHYWITGRTFERSKDKQLRRMGREAYAQAAKAHRLLVSGVTICVIGLMLSFIGSPLS